MGNQYEETNLPQSCNVDIYRNEINYQITLQIITFSKRHFYIFFFRL